MAFKIGVVPQGGQPTPQETGPESWKDYFVRNVGATAEGFAGIPDVLNKVLGGPSPEPSLRTDRPQKPVEPLNIRGEFLNAVGKPEGFGEARNLGESALRFGLGELPFAGKAALSGASQLGRHALGAITSYAGSKAGQKLAEVGGLGERGQLVGALAGGIAAPVGTSLLRKPISKMLKPFELKKQEQAFNTGKTEQLNKLKNNYESTIKDIQASRVENINKVDTGIEAYKKSIEDLKVQQQNFYKEATNFESTKLDATEIKNLVHNVDKSLNKGVIKPQRATVRDILGQLEHDVKGGKLSLKDAKEYKRNLNAETYNRKIAPVVKTKYQQIIEKLNEFIAKAEEAHEVPFRQGENTTIKIKEMEKGQPLFDKQQIKEKSIIEAEARKAKADASKEFKKEHGDISDNTFQKQQLFDKKQERIEQSLLAVPNDVKSAASDLTFAAIGWGLGGYKGSILAKLSKNIASKLASEASEVTRLVREHPELKQEIYKLVASATKRDAPAFVNRFLRTDGLIKKYEEESKPKNRLVIGTAPQSNQASSNV